METVDHFKYLGKWLDKKGTRKVTYGKSGVKMKETFKPNGSISWKRLGSMNNVFRALMRSTIMYVLCMEQQLKHI